MDAFDFKSRLKQLDNDLASKPVVVNTVAVIMVLWLVFILALPFWTLP